MKENSKNIFVYGTLLFPEIVFALTGKNFKSKEATLREYKRFKIFDNNSPRIYPAISKHRNGIVNGKMIINVNEESLNILDFFEDNGYVKEQVTIMVGKEELRVMTYIWKEGLKNKLKFEWSEVEFKEKYLENYVKIIIPKIISEYYAHK